MIDWKETWEWTAKLLLAASLGGAIGWERETHGQAAGLRTNVMVALGSCLLMMLSLHMEAMFRHMTMNSVLRVDPGRIASYAVAGMGFLGAGAIIKGKKTIGGLTTAAGLWLVTGIGLSVGAGYFIPSIVTTLIALLVLYCLRTAKIFLPHDVFSHLTITCRKTERPLSRIKEILLSQPHLEIRFVNYVNRLEDQTVSFRMRISCKSDLPWGEVVGRLMREIPGIVSISWEEGEIP